MLTNHPLPKVSVYIVSHNYGEYLPLAINSVIQQLFIDWELLLIDDGSTDNSAEIMQKYQASQPNKIRFISSHKPSRGLVKCANLALREARGQYFIRLDADDYFDESALLVMSAYLDKHDEIGLVYPNYYYVDEYDHVIGIENRKKIGEEVKLLNLPAHGAGTMIRKRNLKLLGGYNSSYDRQDGWDLWLRFIRHFKVANISLPLFYYRQHGKNLTRNTEQLLQTRRNIEHDAAQKVEGEVKPINMCILIATNTIIDPLSLLCDRPLIEYAIEKMVGVEKFDRLIVVCEKELSEYILRNHSRIECINLNDLKIPSKHNFESIISTTIDYMETNHNCYADIVSTIDITAPLSTIDDISSALNTLVLHAVDSVISVYEDVEQHFHHGPNGLVPVNNTIHERISLEREALYVFSGAVKVSWRDVITLDSFLGQSIGHVIVPREHGYRVTNESTLKLIEYYLNSTN